MALCAPALARAGTAEDLLQIRALQAQVRWPQAESLATSLVARLDRAPVTDSLSLARALYEFSLARFWHASHTDTSGRRAGVRALAIFRNTLPPSSGYVAEAELLQVRWVFNSGQNDSALVLARRLVQSRRAFVTPGDTLLAESWRSVAFALRDGGDRAGAIAAFESVMVWRRFGRGEDRIFATALAEIGRCWNQLDQPQRGRDSLLRSLAIIERGAGKDQFAATVPLDYLSAVERNMGNVTRAIDYSRDALRIARLHLPDDDYEVARIRRNLSAVLSTLGDYSGSFALLTEVLPVYRRMYGPAHWRTASVLTSLGIARGAVMDSSALGPLREAEAIYTARAGGPDPELARVLHVQGSLQYRFGHPEAARALAERALQLPDGGNQTMRIVRGQLRFLRVLSLVDLRDTTALAAARSDMMRFVSERGLDSSSVAAEMRSADARALHALGRDQEAWDSALEAERLEHVFTTQLARTQSDELALIGSSRLSSQLDLLFEWARAGGDQRMEAAWDRCVRDRGLVRTEMARRRIPPELRSDSALVRAHARWVSAQEALARVLVDSGANPGRAREAAEEAERAYARELASHHRSIPPADPTLAEIRARLAAGEALVSFVEFTPHRDSTRLLALIARGGQPQIEFVDMGASALVREVVDPWRSLLARSPGPTPAAARRAESEARRLGQAVRRLVWDRLAPAVTGATDIYVVPDGPVLELPWQALPSGRERYLIEDGPRLHMLPAERDLLAAATESASQTLLAMGSPDFGRASAAPATDTEAALVRSPLDPCAGASPTFAALPATLGEVRDVATAWSAAGGRVKQLVGAEATESAFKRDAPGCTVLHLATHGIVLGDRCAEAIAGTRGVGGLADLSAPARISASARAARRPAAPVVATADPLLPPMPPSPWLGRRTWLALAGAQETAPDARVLDDGRLTAEEVVTLDLSGAEWVVLSACHSGLGEGWSQEGSLGMRRAFALAGARAVIASEWAVEDRATREWMSHLHRARARGAGTAEAMATASRAVLRERREQGRTTHPFYWAAFIASGD